MSLVLATVKVGNGIIAAAATAVAAPAPASALLLGDSSQSSGPPGAFQPKGSICIGMRDGHAHKQKNQRRLRDSHANAGRKPSNCKELMFETYHSCRRLNSLHVQKVKN